VNLELMGVGKNALFDHTWDEGRGTGLLDESWPSSGPECPRFVRGGLEGHVPDIFSLGSVPEDRRMEKRGYAGAHKVWTEPVSVPICRRCKQKQQRRQDSNIGSLWALICAHIKVRACRSSDDGSSLPDLGIGMMKELRAADPAIMLDQGVASTHILSRAGTGDMEPLF